MSKFIGTRFGTSGDGYNNHSLLTNLDKDDHIQYLITSAIRTVTSASSGISKTGATAGDVFSLINAGTGAALYIRQLTTTTDADAAVDIDNTDNAGRALSVSSETENPLLPLVQFSALNNKFDEPILLITHDNRRGLAVDVRGDGYMSGQFSGLEAINFTSQYGNPIELGDTGVYVEGDDFYFVEADGTKHTFNDKVKVSENDADPGYLLDKIIAGANITITEQNDGGDEYLVVASEGSGTGDGYFPFVEVDELSMSGEGTGTVPNTTGTQSTTSIIRNSYNNFIVGRGYLEIKGLTLRTTIDSAIVPEITYDVIKNASLVDASLANTSLSGGVIVATDQITTESETYISGNRKDGEIQFTTGAIDFDDGRYDNLESPGPDGYYYFVFKGDHTYDTKTIIVQRATVGPHIKHIHFEYPTCSYNGQQQTDVRSGQTFDVEVTTALAIDGYAAATSVTVTSGDAIQSNVDLSETFSGSGIWIGTVTARTGQGDGYADINVTATDILGNPSSDDTSGIGEALVSFDNDFPVIESFEEGADLSYPPGQSCLKYGESLDSYMSVSDYTEILYTSPNSRFTISNPTTYEETKTITWDQGSSGVEENADITNPTMSTNNVRIRARKWTNCSESNRYMQIRLDDTPPTITSIRWRRNDTGSYTLTSPVLGNGVHGVRAIFDDPLTELPEIIVQDENKGSLSAFSGTIPGTTFTATLTVSDTDSTGCTELQLVTGINCSHKLPLASDPISGSDEVYCIDNLEPEIIRVEIDVDKIDGYWNDGYDGYNVMNDDSNNLDNTEQACELNFSSGVQSITAYDVLTRHGENVYVSVEVNAPIESGDSCVFDASPWGASSSLSVPQEDTHLYQGPFVTNLGSTRNDDQGRAIGRASIMHETGGDATVTDLATNSDSASNLDSLSANGIDDIASYVSFTSDGTTGGVFSVSVDSFRAFMVGRKIAIVDDNSSTLYRTVQAAEVDGSNGMIFCDGGSLAQFTVAQNARAVPLGVTDAEIQAWDANNGLVAYIDDGAFTHLTLVDLANPEAFSQHLTNDQLTQNNTGTVDVDLFRANFWGSKISVPNTNGGTEANPTGVANAKYVWRSKRIRLTTNPTGVQGTNIRFMIFGFSAGTSYRNVNVTATGDWDQNSSKFDLNNNDSQIDVRISTDDFAAIPPYTNANWFLTTDFEVSPQSGFKFGKTKDINIVFSPPSTDVVDKDIYIEITLTTNGSGKAPQIDMIGMSYLT